MAKKTFVDIDNARVDEQRRVMQEIIDQGHCPFCPENLQKYHKQAFLKEGKYWLITKNQWPYENTKLHLLAIHKTHIEKLAEVEPEASAELFRLLGELETELKIPGGGLAI